MAAIKFLGASVISFTANAGWNSQEGTLSVQLVEDHLDNDAFLPPVVGSPVFFEVGDFSFGGLLRNIRAKGDSEGNPIYSVEVVDPRSLLAGMKVILSGYNGTIDGFGNLCNVYGFYENIQFGSSECNDAGMPWTKVLGALRLALQLGFTSAYTSPIAYKGYVYPIDFTNLGAGIIDLRLGGSMSLMDIILEICEAAGNDLFVTLTEQGVITLHTISRRNVPSRGVISQFIQQTEGACSKEIGEDMINEISGKFLVGAKKRDMYYQFNNMTTSFNFQRTASQDEFITTFTVQGPSDGVNNTIWPFWGFAPDGNPIIATGVDEDHVFTIDTRTVRIPGVGDSYTTSLGELRAALSSQSDWASYLSLHNDIDYLINTHGSQTDAFPTTLPPTTNDNKGGTNSTTSIFYRHNGIRNIHFAKATRMGLNPGLSRVLQDILTGVDADTNGAFPLNQMIELVPGKIENGHEKMWNIIKNLAEEFYGRQFLVSIPELEAVKQTGTDALIINASPDIPGGYLTESEIGSAISRKLMPADVNQITNTNDNTIRAYVRFDDIRNLDFSEISEEECLFSSDRQSIFIPCDVAPDIVFLNNSALTGPRVLITLKGRVLRRFSDNPIFNRVIATLLGSIVNENGKKKITNPERKLAASPVMTSLFTNSKEKNIEAAIPKMAAIPLESQVARYGPWKAVGANGAVQYEEDDTLAPWVFGNYTNMNNAANAKVTDNISFIQQIESGAIEFPGLPNISLGQQLLDVGPYLTHVDTSCSSSGVRTSYRFETWTPRFGNVHKTIADKLSELGQKQIKDRRNFRELVKMAALSKNPKRRR
jgi:hypothetical protein